MADGFSFEDAMKAPPVVPKGFSFEDAAAANKVANPGWKYDPAKDGPSLSVPEEQPPVDAGWIDTTKAAALHALTGLKQTAQTVTGGTPTYEAPKIAAAQPLTWSDVKDPALLGKKVWYGVVSSSPTMAGGLLGAAAVAPFAAEASAVGATAGSAAGPAGTVAGAAIPPALIEAGGIWAGSAIANAAQELGPAFAEEMHQTPQDPDGAFHRAWVKTGVGSMFAGASFAAFGIAPFEGALKNLLFQGVGVQPAMTVAQTMTTNVAEGKSATEDMAAGIPGAITGTMIPGAITHGLAGAFRRRGAPGTEIPPGAAPPGEEVPPGGPPNRPLTPEAAAAAEETPPPTPPGPAPSSPEVTPPPGSPSLPTGPAPAAPAPELPVMPTPPTPPHTAEPALEPMPPQEQSGIAALKNIGEGKPSDAPPAPTAGLPLFNAAAESPPHLPVHEAPDGSGAMTDLSDEDYAKIMQRASPVPPVEVQGEHPEVNVVAPEAQPVSHVDQAAAQVAEPTPAQAEAGNYQKGHTNIGGLDIAIETPRGGVRRGVSADGTPWETTMPEHYGYVKRTEGADGDHLDVTLGPLADKAPEHPVFVIDQINPESKAFDEHKGFLGFPTKDFAVAAYDASFSDGSGPARRGAVAEMPFDQFKDWAQKGDLTKPFGPLSDKPLPVPKEPQRLIPFLQQGVKVNEGTPTERTAQFGLKDKSNSPKGGDLNKIMGGPRTRPGFINNVSGETLENAGQRAWQAGYFDHRPDINELLEAIRKDHNNIPQFSANDQAAVEAYNYAKEWNKQLARGEVPAERPDTFVPPSQEEANYWASLPEGQFQAPHRLPAPPNQGEDLFGNTRAQPTQRTPEPTIRNDPRQQTLEGMEPSARQAQAAKDAEAPKSNQLPADQGLFARQEPAPTTELPLHASVVMPPLASRWIRSAGEKPVDLLHDIPNRFGGHEAAAAAVFHKGRETGHEHLAVVDNQTGEIVHAHTNNEPGVVRFGMKNGIYQPGRYTVHHNHPRDTALSGGDVAALAARGVSHVVAHTAGGSTSAATLSPEIQNLLSTNVHEITGLTNQLLAAHEEAMKASMAILHPFMRDGRLTLDEANHLYSDLANRLMQAKGFIDYTSTVEVPTFVRDALHRELEKVNAPLPLDRYTGSIRPEDRVAGLPSPLREGERSPVPSGGRPGTQELARPREGPIIDGKAEPGEDAAHQGEHPLAGELNAPPGIPPAVKKAAADLLDTKEGASLRGRFTEFLAPMRLGTKETAEQAYTFANKIRREQFNYGRLANYIRDKFSVDDRWKMGRAQAEQSVFERKLARDLDALPVAARPAYEAVARARFDTTGYGHAGLTTDQRYEVQQLSKLADNTWKALQTRSMVDPNAEGWAHWMPRQLVLMESGGKARRIVKDDNILGLAPASGGMGARVRDLNPFGTNMHTDVPGFRNYEEVQETLDAARRKFGPNVHLVDDILGLLGSLQRTNASIHGHDLLEGILDYGRRTGNKVAYTGGGAESGFTVSGNPAMWKSQIKLVKDATGKTVAATKPDGSPVWEKVPVWVHNDFKGPIEAVFRSPPGGLEKAFMGLKALSTHFVMQSPLTHLNVELGRALPLLAGRTPVVLTLAAGRRARMNNDPRVQLLLDHGMAPISRGFIGDPVSLMQEANYAPPLGALGRAIYESPIGSLGKAVVAAHDALARGAGKLPGGEFFEKVLRRPIQTLLWNRVLDLQTAIGMGMYEDRIKAGWAPEAAATAAAHLANRYAGALPPEAMSKTLNTLANIVLFSRSFTGGNLGVMKDTMTGAPKHVLDHIGATAGPAAQDAAKEWLKHKAQWTFALDIVFFYGFTVGVQTAASAVYNALNGKDPEETMGEGYARRFHNAMSYVAEHPVRAMWIPHDIAMLLPTADNEPGKEDRSRIAPLPGSPQWVYARTPAGKVGEEFLSWLTDPVGTLGRKQSTVLKTINEAVSGKDSFGRDIRRPGGGEETANAWRSTERFLQSLFPTEPESQIYTALGAPGSSLWGAETPTRKERILAGAQFAGSLSGIYQPSKGYPLGPVAGAEAERERQIQFDVGAAMPEVRRLAAQGKDDEARALLLKAGEDPRKVGRTIANMLPENTESAATRSANIKNRNAARRGDQPILDRAEQIRRSYGLSGANTPP